MKDYKTEWSSYSANNIIKPEDKDVSVLRDNSKNEDGEQKGIAKISNSFLVWNVYKTKLQTKEKNITSKINNGNLKKSDYTA